MSPSKKKQFDSVESSVDRIGEKANEKVSGLSPELQTKAKNVAQKAEGFADHIEGFGASIGGFVDELLPPNGAQKEGVYHAEYTPTVSRLFIFRRLWCLLQGPIIAIRSIWITIVSIVHYIKMFLTGKRTLTLWRKQVRFARHTVARYSYIYALTDKRPQIILAD